MIYIIRSLIDPLAFYLSSPSSMPSDVPSALPTEDPVASPSSMPSQNPTTGAPTDVPSQLPSKMPSVSPTSQPSQNPTTSTPTEVPSKIPSKVPSSSPSSQPSQNPSTGAPVSSSCTLPDKPRWLVIGTENDLPCSEIRTVNLEDRLTMIFFHEGITDLDKIEVEFKVDEDDPRGDKNRKTKWKIESDFFDTIDSNGQDRPHAFYDGDVLRFRLDVDVNVLGGIGGTDNPDNNPLKGSGYIAWKWKINRDYQLDWQDDDSYGVINVVGPE